MRRVGVKRSNSEDIGSWDVVRHRKAFYEL